MYLKSASLVKNLNLENYSPLLFEEGDQFIKGKVLTKVEFTINVTSCAESILQENCKSKRIFCYIIRYTQGLWDQHCMCCMLMCLIS